MTVSGISSNATFFQAGQTSFSSQRKQDFQDLAKALQSGSLSDAQQAFSRLQQDAQARQTQSTQNSGQDNGPGSQDFKALADALQSGDLTSAQQAFAKFQQDIKSAHHAHRHHHSKQSDTSQTGSTGQVAGTGSNGDGTSSTGGQISITA